MNKGSNKSDKNKNTNRKRKRVLSSPERTSPSSTTMPTPKTPPKRTRKNSIGNLAAAAAAAAAAGPAGAGAAGATKTTGEASQPPPSVSGMDAGTTMFLEAMEQRLTSRIDGMHNKIQSNSEKIKEMGRDIRKRFEKQKQETRLEIDRAIRGLQVQPGETRLTSQQEEAFEIHQRSLRMWPVKGPNFAANIRTLLMDRLKLPADFLVEMGNVEVKRFFDSKGRAPRTAGATGATPAPPWTK